MERRREISPPLVYTFMRSVMEAPFPEPGRTVTVKSFLPGSGNEVSDPRARRGNQAFISRFLPAAEPPPTPALPLQTRGESEWKEISVNSRGANAALMSSRWANCICLNIHQL